LGDTTFKVTAVASIPNLSSDYVLVAGTAYQIDLTGAGFAPAGNLEVKFKKPALAPAQNRAPDLQRGPNTPPPYVGLSCKNYILIGSIEGYDSSFTFICTDPMGGGGQSTPPGPGSATAAVVQPAPSAFPTIVVQPADVGADEGSMGKFSVIVTGVTPL